MKNVYTYCLMLSIFLMGGVFSVQGQTKTINVNLYGSAIYNNSAWNNWNTVSGLTSPVLKYSDGTTSAITSVLSAQTSYSDNGANYPVTMCPQVVGRDASYSTSTRTNTLNGLDNTKLYDIQLYASRGNAGQTTRFTVNGTNVDIATNSNFTNIATFSNIAPVAGKIVITLTPLATYNYLNGFTLTEKPGTANQPPTANAGSPQTIQLPSTTTTLTGSGTDADGTVAGYAWTQTGGTAGVTATIASPGTASTGISGMTTAGTYIFKLTVTDNQGATGTSTVTITVNPPANQLPTANAGSPQTIQLPATTVTLTGSGTDPDGTIAGYAWTQTGGTAGVTATIASPSTASTGISGMTTAGTYIFKLTVTDNQGGTGSATVTITVIPANQAPVANAGSAQAIQLPATTANLTGSGTDADGTITGYAWTQTGGTAGVTATIASPGTASTGISGLTAAGTYIFQLTVTDNQGATGTSSVTITVNPAGNLLPTANAGSPQTIQLPLTAATLTGSGTDADGTITGYAWTQTGGTAGVSATIASPGTATTGISGMTTAGTYIFQLTVTDNQGGTGVASVTITVTPANQAPTANAGTAQNIQLPLTTANLTGSGTDADGTIAGYAWVQTGGTAGKTATIASAGTAATGISGMTVAGTYIFQLTVTDNQGATGVASVTITVTPANQSPVANAGTAQNIQLPLTTATLTGSGTDTDGTIAGYAWVQTGGTAGVTATIASPSTASTGISGMTTAGTYIFQLTVTDNQSATGVASVTITVKAANQSPTANAGTTQNIVMPASTATLTGSGTDADGTIAGYAWIQTGGTAGKTATIASPTTASTGISGLTVAGSYIFQLTVTDNQGATGTASVTITVSTAANQPPTSNAGTNQSISQPATTVTLTGSGTDADGTIAAYAWTQTGGTAGVTATITSPTLASTGVTGLTATGTYIFTLKVTDNQGATGTSTVTITVSGGSILNPADPVITYNAAAPPTQPAFGTIGKWVRTKRLNWNTDSFKCYIYNGRQFRLRFPKSYKPGINDGKVYPLFIFYHGAGEGSTSIYDNEYQLFHGGQFFSQSVDNGTWDGYELMMQTTSSWGVAEYADIKDLITYMITNNKVDPYHVVNNGLSAGGQGTWEMYINNPTYIAGLIPMSAVYSAYSDPGFVNNVKFTPIWNLHGGQDGSPAPSTAAQVLAAMQAGGANYIDKEYITLGHDTWDSTWLEPNFWPFLKAVYMSNPYTLFGRTQFCNGDPINVTVGVVAGFNGYQWRMNGNPIAGATSNTITVTQLGTYDARVLRGTIWSDWSHTPVVISIKAPTVTPNITISGMMSKVIPAPDGNTGVALKVPTGYTSYLWQKVGSNTTVGTDSVLQVTSPGQYQVKVTEQFGCSSSFSTPFTVIDANGPNKPDPASGLLVSALSQTSLLLSWNQNPNPVNNETGFEVYQGSKTGGPYKLIAITGADVSKDTVKKLNPNTQYFYIVRAVNNTGGSTVSNEANATTIADTIAPSAPGNLTVTGTSPSSVSISWSASTDNVAVTEYDIYINGVKSFVVPPTQTGFTIYSLVHKQTYAFTVKAADLAGNHSASSNQVSGEPVANGLAYNYYNNLSATLTVLPDFNTLSPVLTGYSPNVTLAPAPDPINFGFLWTGFITIPTTGKYTFETNSDDGSRLYLGPLNGTASPYGFSVTPTVNNDGLHGGQNATSASLTLTAGVYPIAIAYFQQGGGTGMSILWKTPSTGTSFVTIPNTAFQETPAVNGTAPAAPTNILATATSYKNINLVWTDNSTNETGFEIYRATASGGTYSIVATTGPNVNSFSDSGVQAATTYNYKVQAINQYGSSGFDLASMGGIGYSYYQFTGSWSNMSLLNTLTPVSTGSLNNISLSPATATTNYAFKYQGTINIPTTGNYTFYTASDDGSDLYIGGYDSTHLVVKNDFLQGTTERSGVISLTKGKYPFYVTYFQSGGGVALTTSYQGPGISKALIPDSAFANKNATATTFALPPVPAAPTGLLATGLSSSSVKVTWNDIATNETSYQVWRSSNDDLSYVLLTTLPANSTTFTDNGLFANAVFYYKVSAVNIAGSATSNEDSALTLSVPPVIVKLSDRSARYGITTTIALKASEADGAALSFVSPGLPSFATLTDNGNGTGALTLNPAITDQGVYNIMIIVKNAFSGADTTKFNLTVSSNYDPVMDTIVNYTLNEGDSVNINLHTTDQNATDNLTYTVSNLPNAYTLTNVSNGVATLSLHPGFAAAGVYAVQVNVSDGNGGTAIRGFTLTVNDKAPPSTKVSMRFKYQLTAPAPWNNITGLTTTGLKDDNNNTTGMGLAFQGSWFSTFNGGTNTGNNSGVYPDVVLSEYYFFGQYPSTFTGPSSVTASLTGLDISQRYTVSFMATSSWGVQTDNGTTTFTIGAQTIPIHVQANTQTLATFSGLKPAADGTITFTAATATGTLVGYLNSIVVTSIYDDGTVPVAPKLVTATNVPGQGVQLGWQDVAYNETSYNVYRSLTATGGYAQVGQTAANATGFLDSTISGNTQYFYRVQALNSYGGSDSTAPVSVTTTDRVPKIAAIAPVVLKNNQQTTVNITAADDASDHVTLSVANLPSFASFTDNGNGTGSIAITPAAGNVGNYTGIVVTATDNSDSSRSTTFSITVVDKNVSSTYIMFSGGPVGPAPWNSFTNAPFAGASLGNLLDDAGTNTGMSVSLVNGFQFFVSTGMRPGTGVTIYPEPVIRNGFYESTTTVRTLTVGGLSAAKRYNFVFFNSHDDGFKCLTDFTIGSQTVSLNATYNTNKTVQINGIKPDGNGNVTISVVKESGQDYAFLTTMVVQAYDSVAAGLLSPSDLRVIATARTSVTLQWQDRSTGETGLEVWRATSPTGSYSLLTTLAAGSTSYTNTGLASNATYYYTVRAINGATIHSDYSSAVTATTLVNAVYINFANGNQSPIPWNNTNTIPQQDFVFSNFYDELGVTTNTGMTVTRNFDGLYSAGVQTGNNTGIYPDAVMFDSYGLFPGDSASLRVTNLNESMVYNFTFFGSTTVWGDVNTSYTINGLSALLNTSVNSTGTVTIYGVHPDANGNVDIGVAPGTLTSQFGLLGAMIMQGYTAPATGSAPTVPVSTDVTTGIQSAAAPVSIVAAPSGLTTDQEASVYPNPFRENFTLVIPARTGDNVEVLVYDVNGKIVYGTKLSNLTEGDNTVIVNANRNFAKAGVYIARIVYLNRLAAKEQILKLVRQ